MQSRLAQLIAQSVNKDGRVDRAALFRALEITPDDPVALILEAAFAAEDSLRQARATFDQHLVAIEAAHERGGAAVARLLEAHATHLDSTKTAIHVSTSEIGNGREASADQLRVESERIGAAVARLVSAADSVESSFRRVRFAVIAAWAAVALSLGVLGATGAFLIMDRAAAAAAEEAGTKQVAP